MCVSWQPIRPTAPQYCQATWIRHIIGTINLPLECEAQSWLSIVKCQTRLSS